MPDIIEQLEKGKELLESGKIDAKSLKTKISFDDEKNNRNNSNNINNDNISNDNNVIDSNNESNNNHNDTNVIDSSVNDDSINNDNNNSLCKESSKEKIEKYPDFDFSTEYKKGETIFYVRVNNIIGEKELMELKIRTIYPKMLVCCMDKGYTQCIGPETADRIFRTRYEAVDCYNNTAIEMKIYESVMDDDD